MDWLGYWPSFNFVMYGASSAWKMCFYNFCIFFFIIVNIFLNIFFFVFIIFLLLFTSFIYQFFFNAFTGPPSKIVTKLAGR